MATPNAPVQRHITQVLLVECYQSVLFPVDASLLLDRMPELGWIVPNRVQEEGGMRLAAPPAKGNNRLHFDQPGKSVGVIGRELGDTIAAFREVKTLIRTLFDVGSGIPTQYTEFRYLGWVKDNSDPIDVLTRWGATHDRASRIGSLLAKRLPSDSETMSPYSIRLLLQGGMPTGKTGLRSRYPL